MTITRKFRSVGWVATVSVAALSCYLISYRVSAERGALEDVEGDIERARDDILTLNTEFETRARMGQIERWNRRNFVLAAPTSRQILGGEFALASLVDGGTAPIDRRPVLLASAGEIESAPARPTAGGSAPARSPDSRPVRSDVQLVHADAAAVTPQTRPATYLVPPELARHHRADRIAFLDDSVRDEIAFRALGEKARGDTTD